jgi:class 3 adenylate cyclase/tetratricopeptide (TPR) repeat protein
MRCAKCDSEISDKHRYCWHCGAKLGRTRSECGVANEALADSYGECGQALVNSAADPQTHSFSEATRPEFKDERKHVTILFADLKSSLELLADRDPEDARILLVSVIDRLIRAIGEYGGIVNQVMGDGVMAMFGAPLAYEDHALRACLAALRIQEMMNVNERETQHSKSSRQQVRIGINSGSVLVAERGAGFNFQYTAFGETAHVAARLEQLAKPAGISISMSTYNLVKHSVQVEPGRLVPIRGLNHPIEVFELLSARVGRRLTARGSDLSPFTGRHNEQTAMTFALQQAAAGRGRMVALIGEAGAGKSRLTMEFVDKNVGPEWLRIEMETTSYTRDIPYFALVGALRNYFGINPDEDPKGLQSKISARLETLGLTSEFSSVALPGLFGVRDSRWKEMSPELRRTSIIDTATNIILQESKSRPVLFVAEDLQWIDDETEALFRRLVPAIGTSRILLLMNYRPEYQHDWANLKNYLQVPVESLARDDATKLLEAILGSDSTLEQLKTLLHERTGGNPFFIEESVRTLEDDGALTGSSGHFKLAKLVSGLMIPRTVQDLLTMRIDRLPPEDKRLLQAAAIMGIEVDPAILQGLVDYSYEIMSARLANLNAAGLLYEASQSKDIRYVFKHALSQDVVYESLPQNDRRQLHGKVVDRMEVLYGKRIQEIVEVLAHHALRAEKWEKAVTYVKLAGDKALSHSACRAALGYFEVGLAALEHLPAGREKVERAHDLRIALRHALMPLGRHPQMLPHLNEAERLARSLGDQHRLGQTLAHLCHCHWLMGEWAQAIACGQQALDVANTLGDLAIQVWTRFYVGLAFFSLGEFSKAIDLLTANSEALQGPMSHERFGGVSLPAVVSGGWLSWCLAEIGEFRLALVYALRAKAVSDEAGQAFDRIQAGLAAGGISIIKGDFADAVPPLETALLLCESASIPILLPRVASALAYAYAMGGRLKEALPVAERAAQEVGTMQLAGLRSMCLRWVTDVFLLDGRVDDALLNADLILKHCQMTGERGLEAETLHLLGRAYLQRRQLGRAQTYFADSLELAESLGMRPLAAHCRFSRATLYLEQGERAKAEVDLLHAMTSFRELQMTFWQQRAKILASKDVTLQQH